MLQNQFVIFNIVQESFHVAQLIDEQLQNDLSPQDTLITFNFVSFYTKMRIKIINKKVLLSWKSFLLKCIGELIHKFDECEPVASLIQKKYQVSTFI